MIFLLWVCLSKTFKEILNYLFQCGVIFYKIFYGLIFISLPHFNIPFIFVRTLCHFGPFRSYFIYVCGGFSSVSIYGSLLYQ